MVHFRDIGARKVAEAERERLVHALEVERARLAEVFRRAPSFMVVFRGPRNVYEIEVSRLAAERALSPAVRDYAQRLVHQQTQMNDELVALMSAHGVAPPKGLPADKATKLHRLAALPRSDAFDNGYIRVVGIEDHRAAIASFEKARREVRDRDLRAWIDRSLTILRTHLTNAQGVLSTLAG